MVFYDVFWWGSAKVSQNIRYGEPLCRMGGSDTAEVLDRHEK